MLPQDIFKNVRQLTIQIGINPDKLVENVYDVIDFSIRDPKDNILSEKGDMSKISTEELQAVLGIFQGIGVACISELSKRQEYNYEVKREIKNLIGD